MNFCRMAIFTLLLLPGCATIMHSNSQSVSIITDPAGASCNMARDGGIIGTVATTPGSARIDKAKADIMVTCRLAGFDATTVKHVSEFGGATFANAIAGGLIGVAVDAISGANFPYPDEVRMIMQPPAAPPVVQPNPARVLAIGKDTPPAATPGVTSSAATKPPTDPKP